MYNTNNYHPYLDKYPKHIAIIPDGGRRWAKIHGCTVYDAYMKSVEFISKVLIHVYSKGTDVVTLYFASTSNFTRIDSEVDAFCMASWDYINGELLQLALKNNFKIRIVGTENENFNAFIGRTLQIESMTCKGEKTCNICFNYNSLDEIEYACQQSTLKDGDFLSHLKIPEPVDVLIRTGGANVLSNFLLPQLSAARLYFAEKLFNDLTFEDVDNYINEYLKSELKYGE